MSQRRRMLLALGFALTLSSGGWAAERVLKVHDHGALAQMAPGYRRFQVDVLRLADRGGHLELGRLWERAGQKPYPPYDQGQTQHLVYRLYDDQGKLWRYVHGVEAPIPHGLMELFVVYTAQLQREDVYFQALPSLNASFYREAAWRQAIVQHPKLSPEQVAQQSQGLPDGGAAPEEIVQIGRAICLSAAFMQSFRDLEQLKQA